MIQPFQGLFIYDLWMRAFYFFELEMQQVKDLEEKKRATRNTKDELIPELDFFLPKKNSL